MAPLNPRQVRRAIEDLDLARAGTTPDVVHSVVDLSIEIAREGREGRRIGTLLTVGAEGDVLARSRNLILDPLAGHPAHLRRIDGPDTRETIKELAQLDGGFVVSGDGIALSACRYFESRLTASTQPLGLGTRHLAAASISTSTATVAVAVSESAIVRIYSRGRLAAEILPELWLLHRFMPHITRPSVVDDDPRSLIIASSPHGSPLLVEGGDP